MQTVCVSSNWPSVESLHPRQLDIFVHGWQDDCPPPDVNGAAPAVTAPAVPGQGVGTSRAAYITSRQVLSRHVSGALISHLLLRRASGHLIGFGL